MIIIKVKNDSLNKEKLIEFYNYRNILIWFDCC